MQGSHWAHRGGREQGMKKRGSQSRWLCGRAWSHLWFIQLGDAVLRASQGWRPEMLVKIRQHTGQPTTKD